MSKLQHYSMCMHVSNALLACASTKARPAAKLAHAALLALFAVFQCRQLSGLCCSHVSITTLSMLLLLLCFTLQTSLLLCITYAFSLHMLAAIRGAHYFGLQPEHRAVRSVSKAGVKGWWMGWWVMLALWPVPVYFLPLLIRSVNGTEPTHPGEDDDKNASSLMFRSVADVGAAFFAAEGINGAAAAAAAAAVAGSGGGGVKGLLDNGVSVTLLLALLAGHAVVLTLSESLFAHMVTKTPLVGGMDAPEGPEGQAEDEI
jgi:hypothetical protein